VIPRDDLHELDDATAAAAEALAAGAIRFQPSPRFEERLAARLREAAAGITARGPIAAPAVITARGPMVAVGGVATPRGLVPGAAPAAGPIAWPVGIGQAVERVPRPVLVGGAIASGVSLAGAAVVAWVRLRRSS
jgi:hypothetical protein